MNLPLQIYDFIAVIFPGSLLLALLRIEFPKWPIWGQAYQFQAGTLAIMIVFAYLVGHLIQGIARKFEKDAKNFGTNPITWLTKLMFITNKQAQPNQDQMLLGSRTSQIVVSKVVGEEIIKSLKEFYGFEINAQSSSLFELVYAPVHDRLAKRDVFLAIANMMRSIFVVAFIYAIFLLVKVFISWKWGWQPITFEFPLLVISLFSWWFFKEGYYQNKKYSELIPFTAFLAWYKQQTIKKP